MVPPRSHRLDSGDRLPDVRTSLPGPRARRAARRLEGAEAPGINTLVAGSTAMLWEEALGSNVLDIDGNRYLDLTAGFGVAAVGHRHPAVVSAVKRQTEGEARHTATFVAHPLACAAALATLDVIESESLIERARKMGRRFGRCVEPLKQHPGIVDVRGTAMLWGVELDSRERAAGLCRHLLEQGVIALSGGVSGAVLQIAPPLVFTERQLDYAADSLVEAATGV